MATIALCLLAVLRVPGMMPTQEDAIEAAVLKVLDLKPGAAELRSFVSTRTLRSIADDRFDRLVRELVSAEFTAREAAQAELTRGGPAVIERLQAARRVSKDPEQIARIKDIVSQITNKDWSPRGVAAYRAAIRALARRPDAASVACLLDTLPTLAEDDEMQAAVWRALDAVTVRSGAVPAACAAARTDPGAERRALAAFLLGRRGTDEQRRLAVGLLADPDPGVRLRAAQGLLGTGDLSGIPALVALLDAKPVTLAWEAEELLVWLAGEGAPAVRVGDGRDGAKSRAAWKQWQGKVQPDWKAAAAAPGRPLLLLVRDDQLPGGRSPTQFSPTVILGCDGKVRWKASSPEGQSLLIDRVTSQGRALGFSWPDPDPRTSTLPAFAELSIGGKLRSGPELKFAPGYDEGMAVRRWAAGWTLVAGPERIGFIPQGQDTVAHWKALPRLKERPDDPGQEVMGRLLGEQDGVLWYACNTPPLRVLSSVQLIEPSTGQGPPIPTAIFVRLNVPNWNEMRVGSGMGSVAISGGRVWETVGGRRVWEAPLEQWALRLVSPVLPLVRFGFDDLTVPRKALAPPPR